MDNTRDPYVSGAFYPDDYEKLREDIKGYMDIETHDIEYKKLIGAIVPHAGYTYSGRTAAYAYNLIKKSKKNSFLIIGPNHSGFPSYPAIYRDGYWNTPLGYARVNSELSDRLLLKSDIIRDDKEAHITEHSIEVQLPFLQYIFRGSFTFSPIILGNQGAAVARDIAETIETLEDKPFVLISSDFNHYLPYDKNNDLDQILINDIEGLRISKYYEDIKKYGISACGFGAIATLMIITKQMKGKISLLNHSNSGDYSNDKKRVVGYSAMVAYK
jgi:AmmeMemoRadiSam system protein B